ncbi:MAG: LysR family transcriptional regulator [Pirellulales bacterium]
MHMKLLKVFCDVVGQRSFSRAADENSISQSGASQMVHQLEEHLGVKLLDRSKRPFVLTREGEVFHEGCRKLVQRYFALEEEVRTLHAEVAGRVSVASIYSVGLSHMNQIVQKFMRKYPKANVRVQYQHPDRVYELVESDQVDLGLVSYPRVSRNIRATSWREEPMRVVCCPTHPLAGRESVRLEELNGLSMVSFDANLEIRHEIDRELSAQGVTVNVVMEFDNTETIKRAVEIDAGFSLLPAPTVEREVQAGSLRAIPLAGALIQRPVGIIQRKGKELGQTARRFLQLLQEHSNLPPGSDEPTAGEEESAVEVSAEELAVSEVAVSEDSAEGGEPLTAVVTPQVVTPKTAASPSAVLPSSASPSVVR